MKIRTDKGIFIEGIGKGHILNKEDHLVFKEIDSLTAKQKGSQKWFNRMLKLSGLLGVASLFTESTIVSCLAAVSIVTLFVINIRLIYLTYRLTKKREEITELLKSFD